MKTSKLCTLLLLLTLLVACKKKMKYETIQFHYADGYAGLYKCVVSTLNTGPLNELDTQYVVNIQVTDLRSRTCLFYIDYLKDSAIVRLNGYYYDEPNESYFDQQTEGNYYTKGYGFFRNDSLFYHIDKQIDYYKSGGIFTYMTDIQGKKQ